MKLIILSTSDQASLVERLHAQGHAVGLVTANFESAISAIFRFRPHALVVCGQADNSFVKQASSFVSKYTDRCLVLNQPTDEPEVLEKQFAKIRRQIDGSKQRPIADTRMMFFDPALKKHVDGRKLRTATPEHQQLIVEQDKLLTLMEQAVTMQAAAVRYRDQVQEWSPDETREIVYRTMHGSFKSVAYAQEQLGRWLGVLAHFIPNVDLCYLPTPGDAICGTRWVFDGYSLEARYAFECVEQLKFIEDIRELIQSLLMHRFAPDLDIIQEHASLALLGSCTLIQNVVEAQLSAISRYSNSDTQKLADDLHQRSVRREHQTFTEFWNLSLMREYPQLLIKTVDDFHRGRRAAIQVAAPSFPEMFFKHQAEQY